MRLLLLFPHPCLENNGTLCALIDGLTKRGHVVDIAAPDQLAPLKQHKRISNIQLSSHFFSLWRTAPRKVISHWIRHGWKSPSNIDPQFFNFKRYDGILAVDPQGLAALRKLKKTSVPVAYLSFEQMFGNEIRESEKKLYQLHRAEAKRVGLALVQDNDRANSLCLELGFESDILHLVPVASTSHPPTPRNFGFPQDKTLVLYCGNLEPWTGIETIDKLVDLWPEDTHLIIQSWRESTSVPPHIRNHPRITLLDLSLSTAELQTLARSCHVGLANYHPTFENWATGRNLKTLGRSSGKIATYVQSGLPVLCTRQPSLQKDFDHYGFGLMYNTAEEARTGLTAILKNRDHFSKGAQRYYREVLDPSLTLGSFIDRWERLVECSNQAEDAKHRDDSAQVALPAHLSRQS